MAKGQKRSNREIKKPKAAKKPTAGADTSRVQTAAKPTAPKGASK